jgi:PAS domain S-box-containing protein
MPAAIAANEEGRLAALAACGILDTPAEEGFDDLALLAAEICDTPMALVSLIDRDRQWFKARVGIDVDETPRELSFCAHAILHPDELMVVENATKDARFADHPSVVDGPAIRFYAGAPLVTSDGFALGALCVIDSEPRTLDDRQSRSLEALARQAVAQIELRRSLTEQLEVERRLTESERRLVDAQRVAGIGSWEWDVGTDAVSWSEELYRQYGVSLDTPNVDFDLFISLVHPEDRERVTAIVNNSVDTGEPFAHECRIRRPNGEVVYVEERGHVVLDQDGEVVGMRGTGQDRTAFVLAEQEKTALEARLHQAERLESVGQLAGGIAHDFNNILAVILNFAAFMAEELEADSPLRDDLGEIQHAAERAAELTRQLLVFSRREPGNLGAVALNDVVADVERLLRRTLSADVALVTRLAPDLPPVAFEASQGEQALLNLALNARDAMPQGGTLTVETTAIELDAEGARALRDTLDPGAYVRLAVTDTGSGMSDDVMARALEPFFTTKAPGAGTGLGLATLYGAVTQAGGHIELRSSPGRGTTVEVTLPALGREAPQAEEPQPLAPVASSVGSARRVLLVEDEDAVRRVVCRVLDKHGYVVRSAADGQEAMLLQAQDPEPVDLVLTDLVMPGVSGNELVAQLRAHQPGLRAVYMSGYSEDVAVQRGIAEDGTAVLDKPFTAQSLLHSVETALAR